MTIASGKKGGGILSDKLLDGEKIEDIENKTSFAFVTAGTKTKQISRSRKYDRQQVRNALKDPVLNFNILQETSRNLTNESGVYFRMWKYLSQMLTYDHWIYPTFNKTNKRFDSKDELWKAFESMAKKIDKFNIKYNCSWWVDQLLLNGEIYLYKIDDGKNIVFSEFPSRYCRIAQEVNGVLRFEIDLNYLSPDEIKEYPLEIKNAWRKDEDRVSGKKSKEKSRLNSNRSSILNNNGDWYLVGSKGFAFSCQHMQMHGYPYLSFIFDDVMRMEDAKDETENNVKANNFKLIHNKIGIDKDTKRPYVDKDTAKKFHDETKNQVPEGVGVATNMFETSAVTLQSKENNNISLTRESQSNLWTSSGFSQGLFSAEKATGEGIKKSTITDEMLMFPFLRVFENYFNQEMSSNGGWALHFINSTHQNIKDLKKDCRENLAYGGNRMEFIASCGETPYEFIKRTQLEMTLDIDNYLIPKMTSHTLSSDESGAPTSEESGNELTEAGDINRDYQ